MVGPSYSRSPRRLGAEAAGECIIGAWLQDLLFCESSREHVVRFRTHLLVSSYAVFVRPGRSG